ncbi:MAG: sigma-54-dependent transcriptional regulator [Sulfuriferula sp.]
MPDSLLIIEDETLLGTELQRHFRREGWEVSWVRSIAEAETLLFSESLSPLVVLSDMSLPDGNGLDLLESVRQKKLAGEWLFITGYGTVPDSVRALKLGALDFLTKPCDLARLDLIIAAATRSGRAQRRIAEHSAVAAQRYCVDSFSGDSAASGAARQMLTRLTGVPYSALLIHGETGTGKGLAARILHHGGTRANAPLIEVNCAALPRELIESELFGHEPGAFTGAKTRRRGLFEQADGGTLFLDEVGELAPDLQAKLLKAIEDKVIRRVGGDREITLDVQLIAATNQNLVEAVAAQRFREDFYHRLSVFRLELPPLRQRREDIRALVQRFVTEFNLKAGKKIRHIRDSTWLLLEQHDWPGNVRELRNAIERAVLLTPNNVETLQEEWLQLTPARTTPTAPAGQSGENLLCLPLDGSMALDDMDRHIIQTTLTRCAYNVTAAARALGTTRETLRYRVEKYGLKPAASSDS